MPARFRVEPLEPRLLLSGDPLDLLKDSLKPQLLPEPVVAVHDTQDTASSPSIDWGGAVIADSDDGDDALPTEQPTGPLTTPLAVEAASVVNAEAQTSTTTSSSAVVLDEDQPFVAFTNPVTSQVFDDHRARGPPASDERDAPPVATVASSSPAAGEVRPIADSDLLPIVDVAIAHWIASTPALDVTDRLAQLTFRIVDLPGRMLGRAEGATIQLDPTAAGYRWFVDPSPLSHDEFQPTSSATLTAPRGSPARGRMDLLTVVEHEIGHLLGFDHEDAIAAMADVLLAGRRTLLPAVSIGHKVAPVEPAAVGGAHSAPPVLDLSDETGSLTITLTPSGDVTVSGAIVDSGHNSTFGGVAQVVSGSGEDTLVGPDLTNIWTITRRDAGTLAAGALTPVAFSGVENLRGGAGSDTFVMTPDARLSGGLEGGEGSDNLVGSDTPNTWTIDGVDGGTLNGQPFAGIENLTGGTADDTFIWVAGGSLSGVLSGGPGDDTLVGADTPNTWILTGAGAGTLNGQSFVGIENLVGGADTDRFVFAGGSVSGRIDGGAGSNTLDYAADAIGVTIDLTAGSATATGGILNIGNIVGGVGSDTLIGPASTNTWAITGTDAGRVNAVSFSSIENLTGGPEPDAFLFEPSGKITGRISGGLGLDSLSGADTSNAWTITGADAGTLNDLPFFDIETVQGGANEDVFVFAAIGLLAGAVAGGPGADRVRGPNQRNVWRITSRNGGKLNEQGFAGVESLAGGSGDDEFVFAEGGSVDGTIAGGDGADRLDYSAYGTAITVNLAMGQATGTSGISGFEQVIGGQGGTDPDGGDLIEIGDPSGVVTFHDAVVVSTQQGQIWIDGTVIGTDGASLTIFGSGHTTPIAGDVVMPGDVAFNDSLVIHGDRLIESTGGNITIQNPGTIAGNGDAVADNLTLRAAGTITIVGAVGGGGLQNLIITRATAVTFQSSVSVTGSFSIAATGAVRLQGAVVAPGGFTSAGTAYDNTGGPVTTTNTPITINHSGAVTVGAALSSGTGAITVASTAGAITVNQAITTLGGRVALTAGTTLTSTATGSITTTGEAGGGQGGEVLVRSTGVGAITLQGDIVANGGAGHLVLPFGNSGGNGGVVTVLNANGAVTVDDVSSLGGAAGAGGAAGGGGIVQLSATTTIGQQAGTSIRAARLKVVAGGTVTLDRDANDVAVLAGRVTGGASLTYLDANALVIGTVQVAGTGTGNLAERVGLVAIGGNGSINVRSLNGGISIDQAVTVAGAGDITFRAQGQGTDILLNAVVQSGTGDITLEASGFVLQAASGNIATTGARTIQSHEQLPPGFSLDLSGQFDWLEQGPEQSLDGQILGMDLQGNPVAGAITSINVHPTNERIVYVGTVGGGLWRTLDINATRLVEPFLASKAAAPVVTAVGHVKSVVTPLPNPGTGTYSASSFPNATAGGTDTVRAVGVVDPPGGGNGLVFQATVAGPQFNGVEVVFANTLAAAGGETAAYDAVNRRLTINVRASASTVTQVIAALNDPARFPQQTFTARLYQGGLTLGGVYHYKIVFEDDTHDQSNASDPFPAAGIALDFAAEENSIRLTNLPVGPDGTTRRLIYRHRIGEETYRLVGQRDNNNPGEFFEDSMSDFDLNAVVPREVAVPAPVWVHLTDEYPSLAVAAFAFDPDNPDIFYVGTGSKSSSNEGGPSVGILKTVNTGASFDLIGENEFKGLKISDILVQNFGATAASAQYDAQHRRLTLFFRPGVTTAAQLVRAVNTLLNSPLEADVFQLRNDGSGTMQAGDFENVTAGGAAGQRATGAIFPQGDNTALTFTAESSGAQLNDLRVILVSDVAAGDEDVDEYDPGSRTLTIHIAAGATTAATVVTEVNAAPGVPFTAALARNNGTGRYAAGTVRGETSGGAAGAQASVLFNPAGNNNAIRFTAKSNGELFNDIEVVFTDRINQVIVSTAQFDAGHSRRDGLFMSRDGGDSWRLASATPVTEEIAAEVAHSTLAAVVHDMNGDGRDDLIIGVDGAPNLLYLNNGTDDPFAGVVGRAITSDAHFTTSLAVGDVNGDGSPDLVAGNFTQRSRLYLNNRTADPFNGVLGLDIGRDENPTRDIALGDLDGDGRLDVVVANDRIAADAEPVANRVYLNSGAPDPFGAVAGFDIEDDTDPGTAGVQSPRTWSIALADLDGDGRRDLVAGIIGTSRVYLNAGAPAGANPFPPARPAFDIPGAAATTLAVEIADMDRNGRPDVVLGNRGRENRVLLNRGLGAGMDPFAGGPGAPGFNITGDTDNTFAIALRDVDVDGNIDVLAGNLGQINRYYLNTGGGVALTDPFAGAVSRDITADAHNTWALAVGNLNTGDARADVVAGNNGERTRLYLNNLGATPFTGVQGRDIPNDSHNTTAVAVGDVNRDGLLDVVLGNSGEVNRLYLNNGTAHPFQGVVSKPLSDPGRTTTSLALGDVDDDGDLDLVVGNRGQTNRVFLNNGTADPFNGVAGADIIADADNTTSIALEDLDGDGDLDAVVGNDGQQSKVYLGNGNGTFQAAQNISAAIDNTTSIALGDLNNDGIVDVVIGNNGQENRAHLGNGNGTFQAAQNIGPERDNTTSIALAFMDGTTSLDVVVGNNGQESRLYRGNNNGTFQAAQNISPDRDATTSIALGDVNFDGHVDVVAGNTGQRNKLYLNNATATPFAGVTSVDISEDTFPTNAVVLADMTGEALNLLDLVVGNGAAGGAISRLYMNFAEAIPVGTVTDLLVVRDTSVAPARVNYFAAVVGGTGTFLDINSVSSDGNRLFVAASTTSFLSWRAVRDTRRFDLTIGNDRRTIRPDFRLVASMEDVRQALEDAINAAAAFGPDTVDVALDGRFFTISLRLNPVTNNEFRSVSRLDDPPAPNRSLIGPFTPGVYRSQDRGATWQLVTRDADTRDAVREFGLFRTALRVEMAAQSPAAAAPTVYVATMQSAPDRPGREVLNGIFRSDAAGNPTSWRFVMDSPAARDLNTDLMNEAIVSIRVELAQATNAQEWRNDLQNRFSFTTFIGDHGFVITPDFRALGAAATMQNVADVIETAVNNAFGASATTMTWDAAHTRFIVASNTLLPIEISDRLLPGAAHSLFNVGTPATAVAFPGVVFEAQFALTGDVDPFREFVTVPVPGAGAAPATVENWRLLGDNTVFELTVGAQTEFIRPRFNTFITGIPAASREMAHVAQAIQQAINANANITGQLGVDAVTVLWDPAQNRFLFISNRHFVIQINNPALNPLPGGTTSLFDPALANARFGAVQPAAPRQVLRIGTGGVDVDNPAIWRALPADAAVAGRELSFNLEIGPRARRIDIHPLLTAMPAAANMQTVADAIEAGINHADAFGANAVEVLWNAEDAEFVILDTQRYHLDFVYGGTTNTARVFMFDRAILRNFFDDPKHEKGSLIRGTEYNRQLDAFITLGGANNTVAGWRALGDNRSFRLRIGGQSQLVNPRFATDVPAAGNMDDVARALETAINREFGARSVAVTRDGNRLRILSNAYRPIQMIDEDGLGLPVAQSLFRGNPRFAAVEIPTEFDTLIASLPFTSMQVSTDDPATWRATGNTNSFSIMVDGVRRDVRPNFGTLPAVGATMAQAAQVFEDAINGVYPGTPVVRYVAPLRHLLFGSTTGLPHSGVVEIAEPLSPPAGTTSLVESGRPYLVTPTVVLTPAAPGVLSTATALAGSPFDSVWSLASGDFARAFEIVLEDQVTAARIGGAPHLVQPDFGDVDNMFDVAEALDTAIDDVVQAAVGAAALPAGTRAVNVRYDARTQQFTIEANNLPAITANRIDITALRAVIGQRSMLGPADAALYAPTLRQPELYTRLHPGGQGGLHFSMAVDPTDRDFIYLGGDAQDHDFSPVTLKHNAAEATSFVAIMFRVDTSLIGGNPRPASDHDQLIGIGAARPMNDFFINRAPTVTSPHADSRFITLINGGHTLLEADDGGIYLLHNPTGAAARGPRYWESLNGDLALTEFSDIALDPLNDVITGGAQDVGNQAQTAAGSLVWTSVTGGDGNTNFVTVNGADVFRFAMSNSIQSVVRKQFSDANVETATFFLFDHLLPVLNAKDRGAGFVGAVSDSHPTIPGLFVLGQRGLYESRDNGLTFTAVAPPAAPGPPDPIPGAIHRNGNREYGEVTAVAYGVHAPGPQQPLYVGLLFFDRDDDFVGNFRIFVREPAGTFPAARQTTFDRPIVSIAVDPANWERAYAATSEHVYATTDGGRHWVRITGTGTEPGALPRVELNSLEFIRLPRPDLKITDRDGNTMLVRLTGAETIGHVITMIDEAAKNAGVGVKAEIDSAPSRRLKLVNTGGTGEFKVEAVAGSTAATDLALVRSVMADEIVSSANLDGVNSITAASRLSTINGATGSHVRFNTGVDELLLVGTTDGIFYTFDPLSHVNAAATPPALRVAKSEATITSGSSRITFASRTEGSFFDGVTVAFVAATTAVANTATVSWNPASRVLEFRVHAATTTAAVVKAALEANPVTTALFQATIVTGGTVGIASATMGGGIDRFASWRRLGGELPHAQVVEMEYRPRRTNAALEPHGDILAVGTRGRGTWEIDDFSLQDIQARPELVITTTSGGVDEISLALNDDRPWMLDIFFNGVLRNSFPLDNVYRIVVRGDGADDVLKIDANIQVPGGVAFDAGTGAGASALEIIGVRGINSIGSRLDDARNGMRQVLTGGRTLSVQYRNVGSVGGGRRAPPPPPPATVPARAGATAEPDRDQRRPRPACHSRGGAVAPGRSQREPTDAAGADQPAH